MAGEISRRLLKSAVLIRSAIIRAMPGKYRKVWPALLLSSLLLACGRRPATLTPTANETSEPTEIVALASPTIDLPDPTPAPPTETPAPTAEAACTNDA